MLVVLVGPEKEENLSIRYLSSSLLAAGYNAEIAAFDSVEDSESVLSACAKADIIGLSMCFQARAGEFLELARMIKLRYPGALIVAGGHFASCAAADLLEFHPELDLIAIHEGEKTLVEIADWHDRGIGSLSEIRGIAYRDGAEVCFSPPRPILEDLDALPMPERRGPVRLVAGIPTAYLFGSRGCLSSCDYCCIKTLHRLAPGRRFRQRDPSRIADEMAELYHGRGIRQFIFHDDNFLVPSETQNHRRLDAFEREFRDRGFGEIGLYIKCRPGDLSWGILQRLHSMGLVRLFMGIESSTAQGFASLGRSQTVEESERALQYCDDLGIPAQFTLLIFHPEATVNTIRSDIRFMIRHLNHPFNFGRAELHSGTPLERRMLAAGRARGNYLARGYNISDPTANLIWYAWKRVLRRRCTTETSLMNNAIMLNYLSAAMKRFYSGTRVRKLAEAIGEWEQQVHANSLDLMSRLVDACQTNADPPNSRLLGMLRELERDEEASREAFEANFDELHRRLSALTLRMVGLQEKNGGVRSIAAAKGSMARHILAVTLAFHAAGVIPTYGCMDMEERVLDADQDNLYDDLELQIFGTDPDIIDTDQNGITDDMEDHDGDGIENYREQLSIEELVAAARTGSKEDILRLIGEGVELNAVDPASEETALTAAASAGSLDIVTALSDAGADIDAASLLGKTALIAAIESDGPDYLEVARVLLERGAEVDAADMQGRTALTAAVTKRDLESVKLLLKAGADPNSRDRYGQTVFYLAAWAGRADVVEILIEEGADVNAQSDSGWTPLMTASTRGLIEIVRILLAHGADVTLKSNDGSTALIIAKKEGHTEIMDLLTEADVD